MELAAQRKIVVLAHIALDFPGKGSIAVHVDGLLLVAAPPGPERRACGGVSIATGAVRMQRTKTMASKQTRKQTTSPAKADTGEANKPARNRQSRRNCRRVKQGHPLMRIYIIGSDGITLCRKAPATVNDGEIAVASNEELHAAPLSAKRLLALWNALPGVEKRKKVGDRDALIDQLWSAIEMLPDPEPQSDPKRRSKQDEVIAMLRRSEGATVDEVASATGWQRHTVRGVLSGTLKKKLGLTLASAKEERGRVYRIAEPASL